jgi:hypothetical protein
MGRFWREYNLSLVLAALFIGSWLLQTIAGWFEFAAEQAQHGQPAMVFGSDGYIWMWGQATFENWQSEFLQLFTFVVLTTFLIHRGSAESRDGDDEMQAKLDRIERTLKELKGAEAK